MFINRLNEWKKVGKTYVKVNGEWKEVLHTFIKENSVWKKLKPHAALDDVDFTLLGVYATNASVTEDATTPGSFTFFRSGSTSDPLSITYTVSGTATVGTDYVALSGSVVIPAGESSVVVEVVPVNNSTVETNETVIVTLNSSPNYFIDLAARTATVTIVDEDQVVVQPPVNLPSVTVIASDAVARKVDLDTGRFLFFRSGNTTNPLTINYTVSGTAVATVDYTPLTGTVTIPANSSTASVTLTPLQNNLNAPSRTVTVSISNSASYTRGSLNSATVTIEGLPEVTVEVVDPSASEPGTDAGQFRFARTGSTANPLTVAFSVGGTATSGVDYNSIGTQITIPAGQTAATLAVTPLDDAIVEGAETVTVTLNTSNNYLLGTPSFATITIIDNEVATTEPRSLSWGWDRIFITDFLRNAIGQTPREPYVFEWEVPSANYFSLNRSGSLLQTVTGNVTVTNNPLNLSFNRVYPAAIAAEFNFPAVQPFAGPISIAAEQQSNAFTLRPATIPATSQDGVYTFSASIAGYSGPGSFTFNYYASRAYVIAGPAGLNQRGFRLTVGRLAAGSKLSQPVTITYTLATNGWPFSDPNNGSVTLGPGETSRTVLVTVNPTIGTYDNTDPFQVTVSNVASTLPLINVGTGWANRIGNVAVSPT